MTCAEAIKLTQRDLETAGISARNVVATNDPTHGVKVLVILSASDAGFAEKLRIAGYFVSVEEAQNEFVRDAWF